MMLIGSRRTLQASRDYPKQPTAKMNNSTDTIELVFINDQRKGVSQSSLESLQPWRRSSRHLKLWQNEI